MLVSGCQPQEKLPEIDLTQAIELEQPSLANLPEINICVGSMITPKEGYAYYKALLDYLGRRMKMKVNFIERESYSETNNFLAEGRIDAAFVCGGPYIEGKEKFGLELLAAPQVNGKTVYYSWIPFPNADNKGGMPFRCVFRGDQWRDRRKSLVGGA